MSFTQHNFEDRASLAISLAQSISAELREALQSNGKASLAVSGGSTPHALFAALSQEELDWSKVTITLVDERCVTIDHDRSNAKLVMDLLIQNHASQAQFVPLFSDANHSAEDNAQSATERANDVLLPFDVVVLGMGNDGHTASFFPDAKELSTALDAPIAEIIAINAESAGEPRLTFNYAALSMASAIYLHIEGDDKRETLMRAQSASFVADMPIRAFLSDESLPLSIYWAPKET